MIVGSFRDPYRSATDFGFKVYLTYYIKESLCAAQMFIGQILIT